MLPMLRVAFDNAQLHAYVHDHDSSSKCMRMYEQHRKVHAEDAYMCLMTTLKPQHTSSAASGRPAPLCAWCMVLSMLPGSCLIMTAS